MKILNFNPKINVLYISIVISEFAWIMYVKVEIIINDRQPQYLKEAYSKVKDIDSKPISN